MKNTDTTSESRDILSSLLNSRHVNKKEMKELRVAESEDDNDNVQEEPNRNSVDKRQTRVTEGSVQVPKESLVFTRANISFENKIRSQKVSIQLLTNSNVHKTIPSTNNIVSNKNIASNKYLSQKPYSSLPSSNYTSRVNDQTKSNKNTNCYINNSNQNINFGNFKIQDQQNLMIINNIPVNKSILLTNASQVFSNKVPSSESNKSNKTDKDKDKPSQSKEDLEKMQLKQSISELLKRKSNHSSEAEDEWFENYSKRLDKLAKKEEYLKKESEKEFVMINAFHCVECNLITEAARPMCKNHNVNSVNTTKRFFECNVCHKKNYTLGESRLSVPSFKCGCGSHEWIVCGRRSLMNSSKTSLNEEMVLTASEWNNKKDVDRLKVNASGI